MRNKISAGIGRIALVFGLTGFLVGLMGGVTMYVAMGMAQKSASSMMGSMMNFLSHPDNVDSFGGMAVDIAAYTARANNMNEKDYARMFPGDEQTSLKELKGLVGAEMDDMFSTMRVLGLVGMPFGMAFFGAFLGALGMLVKNLLDRVRPASPGPPLGA